MVFPFGSSNLSMVLILASMTMPNAIMMVRNIIAISPDQIPTEKKPTQSYGVLNFLFLIVKASTWKQKVSEIKQDSVILIQPTQIYSS